VTRPKSTNVVKVNAVVKRQKSKNVVVTKLKKRKNKIVKLNLFL
jgi:hypothetical protein